MNSLDLKVVISSTQTRWRIQGQYCFNIFISDQDTGTVYTISKLTDIKPEGVVDTPDGYAVIQSDISSLEK